MMITVVKSFGYQKFDSNLLWELKSLLKQLISNKFV